MTQEQKLIKKIIKYKKYFSKEEFKKYIQSQLDKILKRRG